MRILKVVTSGLSFSTAQPGLWNVSLDHGMTRTGGMEGVCAALTTQPVTDCDKGLL